MSVVGFVLTSMAGATVGFVTCALLRAGHQCEEPFVCRHCMDTGNVVVSFVNSAPEHRWCNFCHLGQMYEAQASDIDAAWQRLNEAMGGDA